MGSKYSNVSISGYNASPPADDGSQVASNQVTWAKHKTKIGDPLKTAIESINSALVTALDTSVRTVTSNDTTTAADHLKTIQCTASSAGFTVSLGDAATMAAGYIVTIHNRASSTGDVTVNLASASDSINNVTNGTKLLPPGSALVFVVASPTTGYLIIGSDGFVKSPVWVDVGGVLRRLTMPNADLTLPTVAAKGDIPAGTAAGVLGVFTAGANDTIMVADSTQTSGWVAREKITHGAPVTSLAGTAIDVGSIPSWVKRITIHIKDISTNGTSPLILQLSDAGGPENSGYTGALSEMSTAVTTDAMSAGFLLSSTVVAANSYLTKVVLDLMDSSNTWMATITTSSASSAVTRFGIGYKQLSATLTGFRITTAGGTNVFDAGSVTHTYE